MPQTVISVVNMIGPSPDWFVGIKSLDLMENGSWSERIEVQLLPLDAGTDGGSTFNAPNLATTPLKPIQEIDEGPLGYPTLPPWPASSSNAPTHTPQNQALPVGAPLNCAAGPISPEAKDAPRLPWAECLVFAYFLFVTCRSAVHLEYSNPHE